MPKFQDLTGQTFNRLHVLGRTEGHDARSPLYTCRCDCGTETTVSARALKSGNTKSCGCLRKESSSARAIAYNAKRWAHL